MGSEKHFEPSSHGPFSPRLIKALSERREELTRRLRLWPDVVGHSGGLMSAGRYRALIVYWLGMNCLCLDFSSRLIPHFNFPLSLFFFIYVSPRLFLIRSAPPLFLPPLNCPRPSVVHQRALSSLIIISFTPSAFTFSFPFRQTNSGGSDFLPNVESSSSGLEYLLSSGGIAGWCQWHHGRSAGTDNKRATEPLGSHRVKGHIRNLILSVYSGQLLKLYSFQRSVHRKSSMLTFYCECN